MVAAAVTAALQLGGFGFLGPFISPSALDYASHRIDPISALRPGFVDQALGGDAASLLAGFEPDPRSIPGEPEQPERVFDDPPLANDSVTDAREVPGIPFTSRTDTQGATMEPGEPRSCAPIGGTVWYRYRPARSRPLLVSTAGTDYTTTVAIFAAKPDAASMIACSRAPRGDTALALAATGGTTYYFQVGGPVRGGRLVFTLAYQPVTRLASLGGRGSSAIGGSDRPVVSADGRYVVFQSGASDLDPRCPCNGKQVYVRDLGTGRTEMVSVSSGESVGDAESGEPDVSADGRFVSFHSWASNLVKNDTNGGFDVFVRDRVAGTTARVSVTSGGEQATGSFPGVWSHISADGRYVTFASNAPALATGPAAALNIYRHDRASGETELISAAIGGGRSSQDATFSIPSPDGRFVLFWSRATDLVEGATNAIDDALNAAGVYQGRIYVRDTKTDTTTLESVSRSGEPANDGCYASGALSWDARYSVFMCDATNLMGSAPPTTGANQVMHAFRRDRTTGEVTLLSASSSGDEAGEVHMRNAPPHAGLASETRWLDISYDGNVVVFDSLAPNLVSNDTNGAADVFLRNVELGLTSIQSVSSSGVLGREASLFPTISANGLVVCFSSGSRLSNDDRNAGSDAFVRL